MQKPIFATLAAVIALASVTASPAQARYLQTDPIGYEDDVNLYAYVGNDPINGIDPFGLYKCGSSLSEGQCAQFEEVQNQAIDKLESRLDTLQGAQEALANGESLSDAQNAALSDLKTFFGASGEGAEGVTKAISLGNAILGEFKGDKPVVFQFSTRNDEGGSLLGGRVIAVTPKFFASGKFDRQLTLAHEAAHSSGIAPLDFGIDPGTGGATIGPYGHINALRRGALTPSVTTRHPDSIPYALGFRPNRR